MKNNFLMQTLASQTGTALGVEALRDLLLPALVGNNDDLMYWSGKLLARKINLASDNDLRLFFKYAGWGSLKHVKSKKELHVFELSGKPVNVRLTINSHADFKLEAGFIAENFQNHNKVIAEGKIDKVDASKKVITISIHLDPKAPFIPEHLSTEPFSMIEFDKMQHEQATDDEQ